MAECKYLVKCPFFNDQMDDMPATADAFKRRFCTGDYSNCARLLVFKALGISKVPRNLFPNQMEKAEQIIAVG